MLEIVGETLEAGVVIRGAYRLERILGQGGMGVVWLALELATERHVALKFLRDGREHDTRNQERVMREARATMAIRHPNVAAVHAVLETEAGVPFLVMDVLVGESLRARLQRFGPMNPLRCARILRCVASAVSAAHAQRIVHRDLKPDNIYLLREPPDDVRVIDFGIAKQLPHLDPTSLEPAVSTPDAGSAKDGASIRSLTSTGAVLGTPVYMAPEQIFGDADIDGRADIWSLGIVIYECLTGRRPTDGEGFGRIIRRITTDRLEPLEHARPGLPNRLTALVGRMLSRDRNARPSLDEIEAVLASLETRDANAPPSAQPNLAPGPAQTPSRVATTAGDVALGHSNAPLAMATKPRIWPVIVSGLAAMLVVAGVGFTAWRLLDDRASTNVASTPITSPTTTTSGALAASASATATGDPTKMMAGAMAALKARDGATCLRDLDAYDRSPLRGALPPSTDAAGGGLATRAMCTMLAGDCTNGKVMYRKWMDVTMKGNSAATPDVMASSLDNVVGGYCEGNLNAHDRLTVAHTRLEETGGGIRTATSADCKSWIATENELLPSAVPANASDRSIAAMKDNLGEDATRCYAHVPDCKSALAAFRADFKTKGFDTDPSPAANEKRMLDSYDAYVQGTSCFGKR